MLTELTILSRISEKINDFIKCSYTNHQDKYFSFNENGPLVLADAVAEPLLVFNEPEENFFTVNIFILMHFTAYLTSLSILFEKLILSGYHINTKTYNHLVINCTLLRKSIVPKSNIAIVTMFSPAANLKVWETAVSKINFTHTIPDIIIGDNTGYKLTTELLMFETSGRFKNHTQTINLDHGYDVLITDDYLNIKKHAHIAQKYSELLCFVHHKYDYIVMLEDDVIPPEGGALSLYNTLTAFEMNGAKVACVAGCYPQKSDPTTICVSMQPEIWGKIPTIDKLQPRLFRVEMQGGGFAIYNCTALASVLPLTLTIKYPHKNYYMTGWDGTMGEKWSETNWLQYCDGSVFCEHIFT